MKITPPYKNKTYKIVGNFKIKSIFWRKTL